MGLLDRFKRDDSGPDGLTREIAARLRARPDIQAVEATGADALAVTWAGGDTSEESISALRVPWTGASGFDRIELVDQHLDTIQPPTAGSFDTGSVDTGSFDAASFDRGEGPPEEPQGAAADRSWDAIRGSLLPRVRQPVADGTIAWTVGDLIEAYVVDAASDLPFGPAEVDRWGVDAAQVREAALANLRATRPAPEPLGPRLRAWIATHPTGSQAAWLASPDQLLEALGLAAAIVLAPTPTDLVVVDAGAPDLVGSLLADTLTIYEHEAEIRVCPVPFLVESGAVVPWEPAAGDACADDVRRAHTLFAQLH